MSNPFERLSNIVAAQTPSEVIFKSVKTLNISAGSIFLSAIKTKEASCRELPDDKELQAALSKEVEEHWDGDTGRYYIAADVHQLWSQIKNSILNEYDATSTRCNATKRKTEQFIRNIKLDDKHLSNYLIQMFLKVRSPAYKTLSRLDREDLFEQFESLRRTYGK